MSTVEPLRVSRPRQVHVEVASNQENASICDASARSASPKSSRVAERAETGISEVSVSKWPDLDLVAGLFDGSGDAYAEIYRRHSASVTAAAKMILISDHRCEDVVAEVFVSLWFFPEKFDSSRGTLLAYLRLKARGRSIDILRSETARTRRETARRPQFLELDPGTALVGEESALAVRKALVKLPAAERQPIALAFFSGLSYSDVAVRLGIPEGTVKSRIRAGFSRLRRDHTLFAQDERGVDDRMGSLLG